MKDGGRLLAGWVMAALLVCAVRAEDKPAEPFAEPAPRVFYTHPGQFEIIVREAVDAQPGLALGRNVWRALAEPLGLPAGGFSSPVSVRLVPAEQWTEQAVFTVTVEPPGRVSVRVRWAEDVNPLVVRRAFVQGLILRQAAAWHGVGAKLAVPLWLEQACTAWSVVRERPAMLDSFQQESERVAPPSVRSLLLWERGGVESRDWELSALWFFLQLQGEAGEARRWGGWVRGLTASAPPVDSLARAYPGLWTDAAALELWWQTGFHHQRRARALPGMTAEASRAWLADRSRWLAGREGREVVLALAELPDLRKEPWVRTELVERVRQTQSLLGVIHPYYANTALSLGRLYEAALKGDGKNFSQALSEFERDAIDARELEDTVGAILDTAPRS